MADYNPSVNLNISVMKAVDELNEVLRIVKEIHENVEAGASFKIDTKSSNDIKALTESVKGIAGAVKELKGEQLTLNTKPIEDSLARVEKLIANIGRGNNNGGIDNLIQGLNHLAHKMDDIIGNHLKQLSTELRATQAETTQWLNTAADRRAAANLASMQKSLSKMADDAETLSASSVSAINDRAVQNAEKIADHIQDAKSDMLQMQTNGMDFSNINNQITTLLARLKQIKNVIDELSTKTINVNVTNKGFDSMVQKVNKAYATMNKLQKQVAANVSRHRIDAKHLHDDTAATVREENSFVRTTAKALTNLRKMKGQASDTKKHIKETVSHTSKISQAFLKGFYALRGTASILQEIQNFSYNIFNYISNAANSLVQTVIPAMKQLTTSAFEMESSFETARIGFKLFFPNDTPDELEAEIKRRAVASTAFDSASMAKYASQFATLTNGNSKLALDAIEGIADFLMASGQDVSTYLEKVVTNTIQVVSYGKATARDWREFTQKMPIFETILKQIQPELANRIKDEDAEITKEDTRYLLEAFQIVHNNSAISGVSSEYAKTYSGLKQIMAETIQTQMDDIVTSTGFYDTIKGFLQQSDKVRELLDKFLTPVYRKITTFLNGVDIDALIQKLGVFFDALMDGVQEIGHHLVSALQGVTGTSDVDTMIKKVVKFIVDMFKGFIDGAKQLIEVLNEFSGVFGGAGSAIGWMASPAGRAMTSAFTAGAGLLQTVGNLWPRNIGSSMAKSGAFASAKTAIGGAVGLLAKSAMAYLATETTTGIVAALTGGNTTATALTGVGTGMISGAIIAGPLGAAVGGLIGAFVGATNAAKAFKEKVEKLSSEAVDEIQSTWKSHAESLANKTLEMMGLLGHGVDLGATSGMNAYNLLKDQFANGKITNMEDAIKYMREQYRAQQVQQTMDNYTETSEFRALAGTGSAFNYKGANLTSAEQQKRDEFADLLRTLQLLGSSYNYTNANEKLIEDYFGGSAMTTAQVDAIINKYADEYSKTQNQVEWDIPQLVGNIDNNINNLVAGFNYEYTLMDVKVQTIIDHLKDGTTQVKLDPNTLDKIKQYEAIDTGTLEHYQTQETVPSSQIEKNLFRGLTGGLSGVVPHFAHGGKLVRPVYKASGGELGVDTVPVMAQRGEFIVRKSVVDKVGLPAMTALNWGDTRLAASLMGRPTSISDNHARSYNDTSNYNNRNVRQYIQVINKNNSGAGNSYHRLGMRAALGAIG